MQTIDSNTAAEPRVDARWLERHLDDSTVRTVEVDVSGAVYNRGHLPGAVLWDAYSDLRHSDYTTVATHELEQLLERCGVRPETALAFYGYAAHLGYWLVKAHGHGPAVLMDWPRDDWTGPWSTQAPTPEPTRYGIGPATGLVTHDQLLELDGVVLDVRTEAEYAGERFWPSGAPEERGRPGHVPGALNVPISELRTEAGFRPVAEMQAALRRRGITAEERLTVYCTIGNRASQAWYALTHLLGFPDVAVYYGGWAEWGSDPSMPVER
jgi:thiosulfate/3-mercaptopyruvate sulfurtransferase